ncbi:hypothetical protein GCM10011494_08730 [Novosphingobium endophyticum]|uniref:Uncharacterized protein n=1 Tax=Novosphingobium endophyticum TaxID=1955250 RepID=A0A916TQ44_9SPHN|nr:hypothetical protein GCM10011494_08730 [Novosphingobium endophyticum]
MGLASRERGADGLRGAHQNVTRLPREKAGMAASVGVPSTSIGTSAATQSGVADLRDIMCQLSIFPPESGLCSRERLADRFPR